MNTDGADLIYPVPVEGVYKKNGLSKREYFASLSLQGILATDFRFEYDDKWHKEVSREAVKLADALIEALNE